MNLRQKYKKAKQKIAMIESHIAKPKYIAATERKIIMCGAMVRIEPREMEHSENVMKELEYRLMKEVSPYIRVESTMENKTGEVVIRARIRVVDER